jgi:hypothetical protein
MNYFARVSNPTAIKDQITGLLYVYEVGNAASRRSAEVDAKAAQQTVKANLGLPETASLSEWKAAYIESQL